MMANLALVTQHQVPVDTGDYGFVQTSAEVSELWMLAQANGLHQAADWILEHLDMERSS
jgi:hypothetical protein